MHLTLGILRQSQAVLHALAFFWLDGFAVPAPAQVTQTVGWQRQRANAKPSLIHKVRFIVEFRKPNSIFSGGVFSSLVWVWFSASKFSSLSFSFSKFSFISKVSGWFCRVAKIGSVVEPVETSRFFALVLVNFGFERLCQFLFAKFTVGFVGSQNRRVFYSKVSGKLSLQNFVGFFCGCWACRNTLSFLGKSQVFQNLRSGLFGKVFFLSAFWRLLSLPKHKSQFFGSC